MMKWLHGLYRDKTPAEKVAIQLANAEGDLVEARHSLEDHVSNVAKLEQRVLRLRGEVANDTPTVLRRAK